MWQAIQFCSVHACYMCFLLLALGAVIPLRKGLHGSESGPWMQTMHSMFGVGAFVAPLIAHPFLVTSPTADDDAVTHAIPKSSLQVQWAFRISGAIVIAIGLTFVYWIFSPVPPSRKVPEEHESTAHRRRGSFRIKLLALATALFFVYLGMEVSYGGFVLTYAVQSKEIMMSKPNAALLTSLFWGSFALGRISAIGMAYKMGPSKILIIDIAGCLIAILLLTVLHSFGPISFFHLVASPVVCEICGSSVLLFVAFAVFFHFSLLAFILLV
eukprot:m.323944 g.323944  ORF g.323944 m.323944 type:complete len:270 (-) comp55532_c0_seq9:2607-3416(-)